jgi:hypothetical protein
MISVTALRVSTQLATFEFRRASYSAATLVADHILRHERRDSEPLDPAKVAHLSVMPPIALSTATMTRRHFSTKALSPTSRFFPKTDRILVFLRDHRLTKDLYEAHPGVVGLLADCFNETHMPSATEILANVTVVFEGHPECFEGLSSTEVTMLTFNITKALMECAEKYHKKGVLLKRV